MGMTRVDQDIFLALMSFGGNRTTGMTTAQIISVANTSMSSWRRCIKENSIPGLAECAGNKRPPEFYIDRDKLGDDMTPTVIVKGSDKPVHIVDTVEWAAFPSSRGILLDQIEKIDGDTITKCMVKLVDKDTEISHRAIHAQLIAIAYIKMLTPNER